MPIALTKLYQTKRNLPAATAAYREAIILAPTNKDLMQLNLSAWNDAVRMDPTSASNHVGLGEAYKLMGNFGQAEAEYKQAIIFSPDNQIARELLNSLGEAKIEYERDGHINPGIDLAHARLHFIVPSGAHVEAAAKELAKSPTVNQASADVDFDPYLADLRRRIKNAWLPPTATGPKVTAVTFMINSQGELSNLKIDRASGSGPHDNAALDSVRNAGPFRPLPSGSPAKVPIAFTFNYQGADKREVVGVSHPNPNSSNGEHKSVSQADRAKSLYTNRNFAQAAKEFAALVQKDPGNVNSHYYLALSSMETGQSTRAKAEFEWVIKHCTDQALTDYSRKALQHIFAKSTKSSAPKAK